MQCQGKNILLQEWMQPVLADAIKYKIKLIKISVGGHSVQITVDLNAKSPLDHSVG